MGGQVIAPNGLILDHVGTGAVVYDEGTRTCSVGAGVRWSELVQAIRPYGRSPLIMQSNSDFTIGGSLSVNAHGWQTGLPPLVASVRSLRVMLASGDVVRCSRDEEGDLFRHVIGGYGLFGIILDATLATAEDRLYAVERYRQPAGAYAEAFERHAEPPAEMAYGRLCIDTRDFLSDSLLNVFRPAATKSICDEGATEAGDLARWIFRGSIGSEYGKRLRWDLEVSPAAKLVQGARLRRSRLQSEPVAALRDHHDELTDILHEYFVPRAKLAQFLDGTRRVLSGHRHDLLNVTIRDVSCDEDTVLAYAREDVFGLVMLFVQERSASAEADMQAMTRDLIEVALDCGGTFYLPYRLHATPQQISRAYPGLADIPAAKRRYDPEGIFQNQLSLKYLG